MSKQSKEQHQRHMRILQRELKKPGNAICADCPSRSPRWASINLGVFICITCSGIHRGLGVHISKVRSTNLDTWFPEQVEFMTKMGNKKANDYWEGELPEGFKKPSESDRMGLESYIKAKYARSKYAATHRKYDVAPTYDNVVAGKVKLEEEPAPAPQPAKAASLQAFSPKIPSQAQPVAAAAAPSNGGDWADFSSAVAPAPSQQPAQDPFQVAVAAPAPTPTAAAPAPAAAAPVDPFAVSAPAPAQQQQPQPAAVAAPVDPFAASVAPVPQTSTAAPAAPASDPFAGSTGLDSFTGFQDAVVQQPKVITKAVTDDIMKKFDEQPMGGMQATGAMNQGMGMGMGMGMGGFQMPQQGQQAPPSQYGMPQQQFAMQQQQQQFGMPQQFQGGVQGVMPMGGMGAPPQGMGMMPPQPMFQQGMGSFQQMQMPQYQPQPGFQGQPQQMQQPGMFNFQQQQ